MIFTNKMEGKIKLGVITIDYILTFCYSEVIAPD
jgi:hypothetical protein